MTKQEKWNMIVQKIEELGHELQELVEDQLAEDQSNENFNLDDLENSLMGLRMSVDDLNCQDITG